MSATSPEAEFLPGQQIGPTIPSVELDVKPVSLLDRMRIIEATQDFIPTNRYETNEAFGLLEDIDTPRSTANHLNEVLLHQQKHAGKRKLEEEPSDESGQLTLLSVAEVNGVQEQTSTDQVTFDPQAAVRSITNQYGNYAKKARADLTALFYLQQELDDHESANSLTSLSRLNIQNGIGQLVRFVSLKSWLETGEFALNPFTPGADAGRNAMDPFTVSEPSRDIKVHIGQVLNTTRLWSARHIVASAISDQEARRAFWTERLREARRHQVARPIARDILIALGAEPRDK